jgi:phenylpropionate dioxygenase-like ring-hydroxylating dioxygenase large terminal subunit
VSGVSRYPFPSTPDGWFGVGLADEVGAGALKALRYFGRDLVWMRGGDGRARVFDAHCPHLGAHLGVGGRVVGDGIRCPFHGWRYDGEGCLAEVPGLTRKPPAVALRAYPVSERNGFVHVWLHARGAPPSYEVARYREDPGQWTPWRTSAYRVRVHVQDMTENILDRAHFTSVHDMQTPSEDRFDVRFDGPTMVVEQVLEVTAVSAAGVRVLSRTTNSGPGVSVTEVRQGALHMINYITQTPIDDEHTDVRIHFSMKRLPDPAATRAVAELNERITNDQFRQDVPIWEHRAYLARPRLTEIDGPIAQYRRWFRQFYSDWDGAPAARAEEGLS